MAVNINTVYQRVLAIANKEQRGYITPQEFNILANQAQMDIFEQYFYDTNQFKRVPGNNTVDSDMLRVLDEKLAPFKSTTILTDNSEEITQSTFESGSVDDSWIDSTGNNSAASVVADANNNYTPSLKLINDGSNSDPDVFASLTLSTSTRYRLTVDVSYANDPNGVGDWVGMKLQARPSTSSIDGVTLKDLQVETGGSYSMDFDVLDDEGLGSATELYHIFVGLDESTQDNTEIHFSKISVSAIDNKTLPTDLYRIKNVYITEFTTGKSYECSYLTEFEAKMRDNSPLTTPTKTRPVFYRSSATEITTLPEVATVGSDRVYVVYIKKPVEVKWGYAVIQNEALYNSGTSVDFELHASEEVNLVHRILKLASIMMKDASLYQTSLQEETIDIQQEKQ
mgnify:CR=1 FL=1